MPMDFAIQPFLQSEVFLNFTYARYEEANPRDMLVQSLRNLSSYLRMTSLHTLLSKTFPLCFILWPYPFNNKLQLSSE